MAYPFDSYINYTLLFVKVRLILLILGGCTTAVAFAANPAVELERFHVEQKTLKNTNITLKNLYGDVRIRPAPDDKLILHAVYQKIGEHPLVPELRNHQLEGNWHFDFVYPEGNEPERLQDGRIDVVLIVPEGISLDISVERGQLLAKKWLDNDIKATSDASNMNIKTSGKVELYSRVGSISIYSPIGAMPTGAVKTSNGNIDIFMQNARDMAIEVLTTGSVSSNDVKLLQSRFEEGRNQVYETGKTTGRFSVISDTGHVRLINKH